MTEVRSVHLQRIAQQGQSKTSGAQRDRTFSTESRQSRTFSPNAMRTACQKQETIKEHSSLTRHQSGDQIAEESEVTAMAEGKSANIKSVPRLVRSFTAKHINTDSLQKKGKENAAIPHLVRSLTFRHVKPDNMSLLRKGSSFSDPGGPSHLHKENFCPSLQRLDDELESLHGATVAAVNLSYL